MVQAVEKRFGTMAVEKGFVTEEQLFEAMKVQIENDIEGLEHRLIGSILYGLGFITIQQVNEVLDTLGKDEG
jgi:hypothetical protein